MKLKILVIVAASIGLFSITSCGDSSNSANTDTLIEEVTDVKEPVAETTYTLSEVNDSGLYGIYVVKLTDEAGNSKEANFNAEDPTEVMALIGKKVKVELADKVENGSMDILVNGKSIIGEWGGINQNGGNVKPEWKTLTGTLTADAVSEGDLPDEFSVSNGTENLSFEAFITEEMFAASGKEVTIYYMTFIRSTATSITAGE